MKLPNWYVHDPPMVEDLLEAIIGPQGRSLPEKLGNINEIARASPEELRDHLTPVKALRLAATFRLIKSLHRETPTGTQIKCARDVFGLYQDRFVEEQQETFVVLLLDSKHRLMKELTVSVGSLTAAIVHPREVFAPAIKERAAALIAIHNLCGAPHKLCYVQYLLMCSRHMMAAKLAALTASNTLSCFT